jgi:mannosyltransferase OCH1-like enzyme
MIAPAIPRVIHRIWLGAGEPQWIADLRASWDRPGWRICDWTDENVATLFPLSNQQIYDQAPAICPNAVGQLRSDVLRYEILERFGGVYVDADLECLRPIDELVEPLTCFAAWEDRLHVNNAFLGAVPRHPFMQAAVEGLVPYVRARRDRGYRPNRLTGPHYLTRLVRGFRSSITLLDRELIYPYAWNELHRADEDFPTAFAVHHWANQRRLAHDRRLARGRA